MKIYKNRMILLIFFLLITVFTGRISIAIEQPDFDLSSKSAILMEAKTGEILYSKNKDEELPPASMTKIMTMLLVMEALEDDRASLDDILVISENAAGMGGSQVYLEPGEKMSLEELMKAIAISSANDASVAVAEYIAGTEGLFIKRMNERAKELGMDNTYFYNTNGLPSASSEITGNYTTAYDLALLTKELIDYSCIFKWSSTWMDSLRDGEFVLNNTNKLVRHYPGADGLKTGYTSEAKYCLTATAFRDNLRFITVVMGADSSKKRFDETVKLLSYGFNIFDNYQVFEKDQIVDKIDIWNGKDRELEVCSKEELMAPIRKCEEDKLTIETEINENLKAPLKKGEIIGKVKVFKGNLKIDEADLVSTRDVARTSIFKLFFRIVINLFTKLINIIK